MKKDKSGKSNPDDPIKKVSEVPSYISGIGIAAMVLIVIINMLMRKIIRLPIPGFYDITGLIGIIFFSFAIVYAALKGVHISVQFVLQRLPGRWKGGLSIFRRIIIAITSLLIVYAAASTAVNPMLNTDLTTDLNIPLNPFRIVIIVAFLLLTVIVLVGGDISGKEDDK